jgi:hypothetical protein
VRDIGPDLRPNDYAKDNEANGEAKTTSSAQEKEPSVVEDLGQFYSLSLSNWGIYGLVFVIQMERVWLQSHCMVYY